MEEELRWLLSPPKLACARACMRAAAAARAARRSGPSTFCPLSSFTIVFSKRPLAMP